MATATGNDTRPAELYLDQRMIEFVRLQSPGLGRVRYVRGDQVTTLTERIRSLELLLADCRGRKE